MEVFSAAAKSIFIHARDELVLPAETAWTERALEGQIVVESPSVRINVEAYNRKRQKDIAADSKKLLSLAIELKSKVNGVNNSAASPDVAKKLREIEKLAHRVKESMKINMNGPM